MSVTNTTPLLANVALNHESDNAPAHNAVAAPTQQAFIEEIERDNPNAETFSRQLDEIATPLRADETTARKPIIERLCLIPYSGRDSFWRSSKLVRVGGRVMAAIRLGKIRVPFYLSSGLSPKHDVTPGRWYPFFGIGDDNWLNKANGMSEYYGSALLREVAEQLDAEIGDIRNETAYANHNIPTFPSGQYQIADFMNKDMTPIELNDSNHWETIKKKVEEIEASVLAHPNDAEPETPACRLNCALL